MGENHTPAVVQRDLDSLERDSCSEPVVRDLLDRAVRRMELLCATLLHWSHPHLAQPALNAQADELLDAVVERLLKALRESVPGTCTSSSAWPTSTCSGSWMTLPGA